MRRHRTRGEDGAALVEMAIVAPLLFLLFFGILEFGVTFRDQLTVQDAVGDAARLGAIVGPDGTVDGTNADYEMINALRNGLGSIPREWITGIVVFKGSPGGAGSSESQVPAACRNGVALPGRCNVYNPIEAFRALEPGGEGAAYFACPGAGPACSWPPSTRSDGPDPSTIDHVGIWVRLDRESITGVFGQSFRVERAAIVRLEPGSARP